MSVHSSIQDQRLEITVVGCNKLKNTELFSRQDPYVYFQYGSTKYRTRTCTDGGKNPKFGDTFKIILIEGLREINVSVWNSNTLTRDDFIGSGRIQLGKVLSEGFDDGVWPLETETSRYAGDLKVIMHFPKELFQRCQPAPAPTYGSPPAYPPTSLAPYPLYYSQAYQPPPPPQTYQPAAYPSQQQYPLPHTYQYMVCPPQQQYPPPQTYQSIAYPPQQNYPPLPQHYRTGPYAGTYPPTYYQ